MSDESHLADAKERIGRLYDDPDAQVTRLQSMAPDKTSIEEEVATFKALAHEDRVLLLKTLREGEHCACELQIIVDAPQSTVATHLRKLQDAGLVKSRRKGRWTYYRIADTAVFDLLDLAGSVQESRP